MSPKPPTNPVQRSENKSSAHAIKMVVRPFSCWIRELYPIWQYIPANSSVKSLLIENQ